MTRARRKSAHADLRSLSPEQKQRIEAMLQDLPMGIDAGDESAIIVALHATGKYAHSEILSLADHIAERASALRQARPDIREIIGGTAATWVLVLAAAGSLTPSDAIAADLSSLAADAAWALLPIGAMVILLGVAIGWNLMRPLRHEPRDEGDRLYEKFHQ